MNAGQGMAETWLVMPALYRTGGRVPTSELWAHGALFMRECVRPALRKCGGTWPRSTQEVEERGVVVGAGDLPQFSRELLARMRTKQEFNSFRFMHIITLPEGTSSNATHAWFNASLDETDWRVTSMIEFYHPEFQLMWRMDEVKAIARGFQPTWDEDNTENLTRRTAFTLDVGGFTFTAHDGDNPGNVVVVHGLSHEHDGFRDLPALDPTLLLHEGGRARLLNALRGREERLTSLRENPRREEACSTMKEGRASLWVVQSMNTPRDEFAVPQGVVECLVGINSRIWW